MQDTNAKVSSPSIGIGRKYLTREAFRKSLPKLGVAPETQAHRIQGYVGTSPLSLLRLRIFRREIDRALQMSRMPQHLGPGTEDWD